MTRPSPRGRIHLGWSALALAAATACNQAPTDPAVQINPEAPTTVDDLVVTFSSDATDPNKNDRISHTYQWEVIHPDGVAEYTLVEDQTGTTIPSAFTRKGQQWRVTVTTSDGDLTTDEPVVAEVSIGNSTPTLTFVKVTPGKDVDTYGTLVATAGGEDLDGDEVDITFTWYVDGVALDVEGSKLQGDHFSKNQEVWVEAVVSDGETEAEPVASNSVRISNSPPTLDGAVIDPSEVYESSVLTCTPVGWFDPDGDEPLLDATWMVNGVEVGTGILDGASFGKGDLIRCMGRPNDGDSLGDTVVSPVVQVGNTAPTLGGVTLTETSPRASATLGFTTADAIDVDGDELSYKAEWYVGGELIFEGMELPPGSFVKGQDIYVVVTPFDGNLWGDPVTSASATSVNTPPDMTSVTLVPTDAYTNSVLFPEVEAMDLDGDRITYTKEWTVNGSVVSELGATLDGADWFQKGDEVSVTIVPNDGTDDGPSLTSATVTILNSMPTTPEVRIDPEKPNDTYDLWCEIMTESTDEDTEDTLVTTIEWTRNGAAFTDVVTTSSEGDTVLAENTVDGDVFTCTVTVSDGTETVEVVNTVSVLNWAGPRVFTNCGASGYAGPTQSMCDSSYSGKTLEGEVSVSGGLQTWVVPDDGTYSFTVSGAQGGRGSSGSSDGYKGAEIYGEFDLVKGEEITILVGQAGQSYAGAYGAGGGGGTFVHDELGATLMVAGGGGGNGYAFYNPSGCEGQAGARRGNGSGGFSSGCSTTAYSGTDGGVTYYQKTDYGYIVYNYYYGGGGAGLTGDGTAATTSQYSRSYDNGGLGGNGTYVDGGFGGGGIGGYQYSYTYYGSSYGPYGSSFYGSGGGGGYAGGGGGYYRGGGGSSYNIGDNPSGKTGANAGMGQVVIDKL